MASMTSEHEEKIAGPPRRMESRASRRKIWQTEMQISMGAFCTEWIRATNQQTACGKKTAVVRRVPLTASGTLLVSQEGCLDMRYP
jgi:hypothetical protein